MRSTFSSMEGFQEETTSHTVDLVELHNSGNMVKSFQCMVLSRAKKMLLLVALQGLEVVMTSK